MSESVTWWEYQLWMGTNQNKWYALQHARKHLDAAQYDRFLGVANYLSPMFSRSMKGYLHRLLRMRGKQGCDCRRENPSSPDGAAAGIKLAQDIIKTLSMAASATAKGIREVGTAVFCLDPANQNSEICKAYRTQSVAAQQAAQMQARQAFIAKMLAAGKTAAEAAALWQLVESGKITPTTTTTPTATTAPTTVTIRDGRRDNTQMLLLAALAFFALQGRK